MIETRKEKYPMVVKCVPLNTKGRMKDISPEYSSEKRSNRVEPGGLSEESSGEGEGGQVLEAGHPALGTR